MDKIFAFFGWKLIDDFAEEALISFWKFVKTNFSSFATLQGPRGQIRTSLLK
jgi:hypothetical protein